MTDGWRDAAEVGVLVVGALTVAVLWSGCGAHARYTQQRVMTVAALSLLEADEEIAPRYAEAHQDALEEAQTRAEYDARMRPWRRVVTAMEMSRDALLALQAAHDAAGSEGFLEAAGCALLALRHLAEALLDAGVEVPGALVEAIAALGAYANDACGRPES